MTVSMTTLAILASGTATAQVVMPDCVCADSTVPTPGGTYSGAIGGLVGATNSHQVTGLPTIWYFTGHYRPGWPGGSIRLGISPLAFVGLIFGDLGVNFSFPGKSSLVLEAGVDGAAWLSEGIRGHYVGPYLGFSIVHAHSPGTGKVNIFTLRIHAIDGSFGNPTVFSIGFGVGTRR